MATIDRMLRRAYHCGGVASLALTAAAPGSAQQAPAAPAQAEPTGAAAAIMQDIVVTARKRSEAERAQDVPIALTAVSGRQIEAMFAKDLTDVGMTMPNVRLDNTGAFPGVANYTIRGMGFNSTIASVEPTVGVFQDGIYLGLNLGGAPDTYDTESVEVLRGPQGTLFGRNVTGGAVVTRSRRPTGEFGGDARFGIGSGGRRMIAGGVEGPISDTLAAKVYASFDDRHGDFDNITIGGHQGAQKDYFVRPILRWRPSSGVDITAIGEYGHTTGDGVTNRVLNDPNSTLYKQGIREPLGGADKLSDNYKGDTLIIWHSAVLEANIDLGPGKLTSITGYRDTYYSSAGDTDGSQVELARAYNHADGDQFSEELRYAGKAINDKLDFTVGAYYFHQFLNQYYHVIFGGASNQRSQGQQFQHALSGFAQADFEVIPTVTLSAGGRYTTEYKHAYNARTPQCTTALVCTLSDSGSKNFHNFTPKVGASWKPEKDVLLYVSWTKGFRSGGFNIRTTGVNESPGPYNQEIVKALEGGIKTEFWDHRARFNLSVFHNKYTNLQRTVNQGLVNFIANVAAATVDGVEAEANLLPVKTLAITAAVGYLNARYDSYPTLDVNGDGIPDPALAKGLKLVRAPKWTYTIAATHDMDLHNAGSLSTRVSFQYNGRTTMNDANTYFVPSFHLLDASLTWSPAGNKNLKVSAWGKNLTNKTYALTGTVTGIFTDLYQSLPRTYGMEVAYRF